jgi:5-formyltetrahydrofolate cyclo-ligase
MPEPTKAGLRAALSQRRQQRSVDANATLSAALLGRLLRHPLWQQARGIAAFVGVRGEPDTWGLLAATLAERKRLWLPRMEAGEIAFVPVNDLRELAPAKFGLLEPRPRAGQATLATPTPAAGIDVVLVPGLGFNSSGGRLGWGKGHYDRALAPVHHAAAPLRVGLCFEEDLDPEDGQIPTDAHDVPMHWVATPTGITFCAAAARAGAA